MSAPRPRRARERARARARFAARRAAHVEGVARRDGVALAQRDDERLDAHVRAEHDLHDVVHEREAVEAEAVARQPLHHEGPHADEGEVRRDDREHRAQGPERPALRARATESATASERERARARAAPALRLALVRLLFTFVPAVTQSTMPWPRPSIVARASAMAAMSVCADAARREEMGARACQRHPRRAGRRAAARIPPRAQGTDGRSRGHAREVSPCGPLFVVARMSLPRWQSHTRSPAGREIGSRGRSDLCRPGAMAPSASAEEVFEVRISRAPLCPTRGGSPGRARAQTPDTPTVGEQAESGIVVPALAASKEISGAPLQPSAAFEVGGCAATARRHRGAQTHATVRHARRRRRPARARAGVHGQGL